MTLHTQLQGFVNRYGIDCLKSPALAAMMADEKMFADPDDRTFKPLFRQMTSYDHIKQLVYQWSKDIPSPSTYMAAYPGWDFKDIRYVVECVGYAMGKIDSITETSSLTPEITQAVNLEDDTVEYISHGSSDNIGTLIPAVMAQPVHRHLNEIANDEGSVIEFVRAEMCEPDEDAIRMKISGEQIDGVALAMREMIDGRAFILGDMTGIGKGRQLAMLLKWAQRHGYKPVFVTEKSTLFNDLFRDLSDIGYADMRPFILNSDRSARITDQFGGTMYNLPAPDEIEEFKNTGRIPVSYDFLLMTYSQVNKDPKTSWKPSAVLSAINDTYLILDESHNATGIDSNVGTFFREAVDKARGVCFASATYAKYPSSMPIYAMKTAMGYANIPPADLLDIVSHGGPILQEVMAQGLVESGSMVRRQRDMTDVERILATPVDANVMASLRESYDKIIELMDLISDFQFTYLRTYTEWIDPIPILDANCNLKAGECWKREDCWVKDWNPQVRMAPIVRQLLYVLKTEYAIEKTVEELKAGRKPIVQVARTMASSIARVMKPGERCDHPDFSMSLQSCIDDMFQYEVVGKTVKKVGKKEYVNSYSVACKYSLKDVLDFFNSPQWCNGGNPKAVDIAKEVQYCYDELVNAINTSLTGLPLSPLDYFVQRLRAEGYSVGELTQRSLGLLYDDPLAGANSPVECVSLKKGDKKQLAADFNAGKIDVLVGNKVMASGISLHSSSGFADTRPRTVITWEQQDSADVQTQFDGRADRTGQLSHCRYIVLASPVPAELRYLMLHTRKQRSLNANVEANQNVNSVCVDIFNKYGAKVIDEFCRDNPIYSYLSWNAHVALGASRNKKSMILTEGSAAQFVSTFMRDIGLLPCVEQEAVIDGIMSRYRSQIESLDENDENDLHSAVLPLKAELLKRVVFAEGSNGSTSPFAADANLDLTEVNVLRKPLTSGQILEHMSQLKDLKAISDDINRAFDDKIKRTIDHYTTVRNEAVKELASTFSPVPRTVVPKRIVHLQAKANNTDRMNDEVGSIKHSRDSLLLNMRFYQVGRAYSIPSILMCEGQVDDPDYAKRIPVGIFMGFRVDGGQFMPSKIKAVFAVNDSRSIVRVPMSDTSSIETIMRQSQLGVSRSINAAVNLGNWDTKINTRNREAVFLITGNILAGIAKCKEYMRHTIPNKLHNQIMAMARGRMIKYTDIHGNICTAYMLSRLFDPKLFFANTKL